MDKRNKSNEYSKKLNTLFKEAIKLIAEHPEIGKPTDNYNARIKVVRDYLIIYEIKKENINILSIWDSRQNQKKLRDIIKKYFILDVLSHMLKISSIQNDKY